MNLAQRCGAQGTAHVSACQALLHQLQAHSIEQLRVCWADLQGMLRSKTLVLDANSETQEQQVQQVQQVQQALQNGIGMVSTLLLKDVSDRTALAVFDPAQQEQRALLGLGSANNMLLLPDPGSLVHLPWAAGTAWLRADAVWADGSPVASDPRHVLLRALQTLASRGFELRCGLEVEFHVYRIRQEQTSIETEAWTTEPPDLALVHPGYSLLGDAHADQSSDVISLVRKTLLGLQLPLRSIEIELGPSQFEVVLAPTDALSAADQMVRLRNGLRQALRRAGLYASFVCKPPFAGAVASGWHLHQSLVDLHGQPVMGRMQPTMDRAGPTMDRPEPKGDASSARQLLSDTGAFWLAGLLAHAPGMAALCAPSIPAYRRFQGSVMAPQAAVWGFDNRGAMLRVLGEAAQGCVRIENRIGEPMANPYLMMAAQVLAGLDGLQCKLQPPPAVEDPYASGHPALPDSLQQALKHLAADTVLCEGLGPALLQAYLAVRNQELARQAQCAGNREALAAWERREYFARF